MSPMDWLSLSLFFLSTNFLVLLLFYYMFFSKTEMKMMDDVMYCFVVTW